MARLIAHRAPHTLAALLAATMIAAPFGSRVDAAPSSAFDSVTIAMGYIPNVQFAPFYVADARGYYAHEHLKVRFSYAQSPDIIKLIGSGDLTFGNAEGDQVVVGRTSGIPVVSVLTQYQRFPVVIFALASSHIRGFADLKGKTIGIPGLYGASYTGLLAALRAVHLSTQDVRIEAINYTQVSQIAQHQVDAAVGYAMNEPVQLQQLGYKVSVLPVAAVSDLAGAGVITSGATVSQHPDLVRRFVAATYRGLSETDADPDAAFGASRPYIRGLTAAQIPLQRAVLREAVRYWRPGALRRLGCGNGPQWSATESALLSQKQIHASVPVSTLFTNRFVPGC